MSINVKILILILSLGALGCSNDLYKKKLIPGSRDKTFKNPYGAYIELTTGGVQYAGEYVAYWHDTLYVMSQTDLIKLPANTVSYFEIILTRNKYKTYLLAAGFSMIPAFIGIIAHPDYSSEFLKLGLVTGAMTGIAAAIESGRTPTIISYPKDLSDITMSTKYARFPAGLPEGFNESTLQKPYQSNK